ncbi:unnamed protein product [Schistosoma spindalis]|nr:unnamed protein product [Schistosoma spindale]
MNKLSLIQLFIFTFVILTIKINGANTDTYDKRASLAYFKRRNEISDSTSDSPSKRATLYYYKRDQYDQQPRGIYHIRQIAEICPCLNKDYLHWLEENLLISKHNNNNNNNDDHNNLESEKRASLSYFK